MAGYPYVNQVKDSPTQKALIEAFDQIGKVRGDLDTIRVDLTSLTATVATLQAPPTTTTTTSSSSSSSGLPPFNPGDTLVADATGTVVGLADVAVGSYLRSGGVLLPPTWGALAAGGANTQVQFNSAGSFAGDADMTFVTDTLTVTKLVAPTSVSTPSLISTAALTITPLAGQNLNIALSTTGVFSVVAEAAPKITINTFTFLYAPTGGADGGVWENIFLGYKAGNSFNAASNGSANVGIGTLAGATLNGTAPNAVGNTLIGYAAGNLLSTGNHNVHVGADAGATAVSSTNQVFVGSHAGQNAVGNTNIGIGANALAGNATCTGEDNTFVGFNTATNLKTGTRNVGIGYEALQNVTDGARNISIGFDSIDGVTTGNDNIVIGFQCGNTLTTGSRNIIIGKSLDVAANNTVDYLNIGNLLRGDLSTFNLSIGTVAPTARLHLPAGAAAASSAPLKLTSGTSLTTAEAGAIEFTTDDFFATITTGAARKGFVLDNGSRLTSGKVPVATTNGRLVDATATTLVAAGLTTVVASTFEKAGTGSDANVLTYTVGAADEYLLVMVSTDISALTGTSLVVSVAWTDSNNAAQTTSITLSGVADGSINVPINGKTATNVVVSTTFVGVSTAYKISAYMVRLR